MYGTGSDCVSEKWLGQTEKFQGIDLKTGSEGV